jgi:Zn-dependent M28 family amino/carboxypeptidase
MKKVFPNYIDLIDSTVKNASELKAQKPVTSNMRIVIEGIADIKKIESDNILAIIKGSEKPEEVIVVGAHYDHMGAYKGFIWNGADDNASGAIGTIAIARAFAATGEQPKRTVIFAVWTAEERGLLGSKYFLNSYPDARNILYYHNYDMIGRSYNPSKPDSSVALLYTKSWGKAEELVRAAVKEYDLELKVNYSAWDNPVSGSDNATFAKRGIPIMWFHTGGHPDYHKPSDHYDKIDWQKMRNIIKVSFISLWELANE